MSGWISIVYVYVFLYCVIFSVWICFSYVVHFDFWVCEFYFCIRKFDFKKKLETWNLRIGKCNSRLFKSYLFTKLPQFEYLRIITVNSWQWHCFVPIAIKFKTKQQNTLNSMYCRHCSLCSHLRVLDAALSDAHPPDLLRAEDPKLDPLHHLHRGLGVAGDDWRHPGRLVRNFLNENCFVRDFYVRISQCKSLRWLHTLLPSRHFVTNWRSRLTQCVAPSQCWPLHWLTD